MNASSPIHEQAHRYLTVLETNSSWTFAQKKQVVQVRAWMDGWCTLHTTRYRSLHGPGSRPPAVTLPHFARLLGAGQGGIAALIT